MQPTLIMAFRKRMKKRGYTNISIKLLKNGLYKVSANEPLGYVLVSVEYSLLDMRSAFRF